MANIEGFRVTNFRALKDVTLGRLWNMRNAKPLTPMTAVIGKKRRGKEYAVRCLRIPRGLPEKRC